MGLVRVMICLGIVVKLAAAADHIVGGPSGWTLGIDFATWASSHTFLLGDKLLFEYNSAHSVVEVQEADYSKCEIISTPIATYMDSSTTITLTTPGNRYFICATPGHCTAGMKLEVNIVALPSPSPPPQLPSSPPPKAPTTPPPQLSTSPPPKGPSSPPPKLPTSPPPIAPSSPPPKLPTSPPPIAPSSPSPVTSTSPPPESPASSPLPGTTPAAGPAPPKSSACKGSVFSMLGWFIAISTGFLMAM